MSVPVRPSTELRRAVLAFSLREPTELADLTVTDAGVRLPTAVFVPWAELAAGCGEGPGLVRRVARWLRLRDRVDRAVAAAGPDVLLGLVRPVALPVGHGLTPGPGWQAYDVLGGALEVGLGLRHVDDDGRAGDGSVGLLPVSLLRAARIDHRPLIAQSSHYLGDMGELAAERLLHSSQAPLRPVGDCDVVTLLASPAFRRAVVQDAAGVVGLRAAAVPDRRRGWLDLSRVDPAFALVAASLTEPDQRGFSRPLLITADEVVQVRDGGSPTRFALADPVGADRTQPIQRLG